MSADDWGLIVINSCKYVVLKECFFYENREIVLISNALIFRKIRQFPLNFLLMKIFNSHSFHINFLNM